MKQSQRPSQINRYFQDFPHFFSATFFAAVMTTLAGCQTVQRQSIPLPTMFLAQAEQIDIKRPTWRLNDTIYQQHLPGYEIHSTKTSWAKSERSELWFSSSGGLLDGIDIKDKFLNLLFLDLLDLRKKTQQHYRFHSEQDFGFVLAPEKETAINVRCRRVALEDHQDIQRVLDNQRISKTEIHQRLASYLACEMQQGKAHWRLTVNSIPSANSATSDLPQIQLLAQKEPEEHTQPQQVSQDLQFGYIKESSFLVDGAWRTMRFGSQQFSGLQIDQHQRAISALSFDGTTPSVWLKKDLPPKQKSLLLATAYSLMMYDWLDAEWRSN